MRRSTAVSNEHGARLSGFLEERHRTLVEAITRYGFDLLAEFDRSHDNGITRLDRTRAMIAAGADLPDRMRAHLAAPVRITLVEFWDLRAGHVDLVEYRYQLRVGTDVERWDLDPAKRDEELRCHLHPFGQLDVREPATHLTPQQAVDLLLTRLSELYDATT